MNQQAIDIPTAEENIANGWSPSRISLAGNGAVVTSDSIRLAYKNSNGTFAEVFQRINSNGPLHSAANWCRHAHVERETLDLKPLTEMHGQASRNGVWPNSTVKLTPTLRLVPSVLRTTAQLT